MLTITVNLNSNKLARCLRTVNVCIFYNSLTRLIKNQKHFFNNPWFQADIVIIII